MTRIATGWQLAKDSWGVLRDDASLSIFPILSFIFSAIAFALIIAPGILVAAAEDSDYLVIPFLLVAAYAATFFAIYFQVALAGAAMKSLDGADTKLSDGTSVANTRLGQIAKWAGVQLVVGILLNLIQEALQDSPAGRIVGSIIAGLLNAAWAIATFFVIPVLAFEGLGPMDALKRSGGMIKERWGEGLVGAGSIGLALFLVFLLPMALFGVMIGAGGSDELQIAGGAGLVVCFIAMGVLSTTLNTIFRVALYRYAGQGEVTKGFDVTTLDAAFKTR